MFLNPRIAWWEGPPCGGGQHHFEYSGRTADLHRAIDLFAHVASKRKQVVVRAGEHTSFWLNIQGKAKKHVIDWHFPVGFLSTSDETSTSVSLARRVLVTSILSASPSMMLSIPPSQSCGWSWIG